MRSTPRFLFAASCGFVIAVAACYEDLHVAGESPTNYAWHAVYVDEDAAHDIAPAPAPTLLDPYAENPLDDPIGLGNGLFARVDSLRGLYLYASDDFGDPRSFAAGFVVVPGITGAEALPGGAVVVDNLGDRVTLAIDGPADVRELAREPSPPMPPPTLDPTRPPGPAVTGYPAPSEPLTSEYFACPGESGPGRFLGWRLLLNYETTVPLCRYR